MLVFSRNGNNQAMPSVDENTTSSLVKKSNDFTYLPYSIDKTLLSGILDDSF